MEEKLVPRGDTRGEGRLEASRRREGGNRASRYAPVCWWRENDGMSCEVVVAVAEPVVGAVEVDDEERGDGDWEAAAATAAVLARRELPLPALVGYR